MKVHTLTLSDDACAAAETGAGVRRAGAGVLRPPAGAVRMTNQGLTDMKVLDQEAKNRLNNFEKLLERLLAVVEKELDDKELTEEDYQFIRNFGEQLQYVSVKSTRHLQLAKGRLEQGARKRGK